MTQGVYVNYRRPPTKKALREAVADDPSTVSLEATSMFGNEYDGSLAEASTTQRFTVVGPDPYNKRNWYANIIYDQKKEAWVVK